MTLQPLWKGSEMLHKLLADYLGGRIDTTLFCDNFEQAFNLDVDRRDLTPREATAFKRLFDEVVYFSPFPGEPAKSFADWWWCSRPFEWNARTKKFVFAL